ncbi:MAG: aminotransferase class IV family protein [Anaerolineales bacterium]|nr:aminotransferase class IV family protein [Anaerolineales bacterium]
MKIIAYHLAKTGNIPFETQATTLDEMTRELPQGFYTTFGTLSHGTTVLGLKLHLQRLYKPAQEYDLTPAVDEPTLRNRIAQIAKSNLPKESRIRLILTKNKGEVYIGAQPFEPLSKKIYENGVKVITTELVRQVPRVKDTGFISSSIAQRGQVEGDVFEILLTKNGQALEGMTSNFYIIKGKTLVTAKHGILPGVTRRAILRLARGQGMSIEYRWPRLDEKFDEAFITSSSRGVVPIISIDNMLVGDGKVGVWVKTLSQAYQVYVGERSEKIIK